MNPNTGEIRRLTADEAAPKGWVELKESEAVTLLRMPPAERAAALRAMRRPHRRHLEREIAKVVLEHGEAPER